MMPTALLLCGFPLARCPSVSHIGIAVQRFSGFRRPLSGGIHSVSDRKVNTFPANSQPLPQKFSYSFKGCAPKNPLKEPKMLCHQPVGMHPGASA